MQINRANERNATVVTRADILARHCMRGTLLQSTRPLECTAVDSSWLNSFHYRDRRFRQNDYRISACLAKQTDWASVVGTSEDTSMSAAARAEVSRRMKRYWAERRKAKAKMKG